MSVQGGGAGQPGCAPCRRPCRPRSPSWRRAGARDTRGVWPTRRPSAAPVEATPPTRSSIASTSFSPSTEMDRGAGLRGSAISCGGGTRDGSHLPLEASSSCPTSSPDRGAARKLLVERAAARELVTAVLVLRTGTLRPRARMASSRLHRQGRLQTQRRRRSLVRSRLQRPWQYARTCPPSSHTCRLGSSSSWKGQWHSSPCRFCAGSRGER